MHVVELNGGQHVFPWLRRLSIVFHQLKTTVSEAGNVTKDSIFTINKRQWQYL